MESTSTHLEEIDRQGYTILPDVFDAERANALVARLDELVDELGVVPSDNDFEGRRTRRVYNLLAHGTLFEEIAVEPAVLAVVDGVLDPGCLVSSLSSIDIG